jgi:outer membrane protein assembly factor BamE (lipoprotein component of BamABCDE complex)
MFIRANKRGNKVYYYIVKSIREGSKVKQKVLLYLGTAEKVYKRLKSNK